MTMTERVAKLFRAHRRTWIHGRRVSRVGGYGGFRSRITELRKAGMRIVCEVRSVQRRDGSHASTSFYRYEGRH